MNEPNSELPLLRLCNVMWSITSEGGVTLRHMETDSGPSCVVSFHGTLDTGEQSSQPVFIEIEFVGARQARTNPHPDHGDLRAVGFEKEYYSSYDSEAHLMQQHGHFNDWLNRWIAKHRRNPLSGFYFVENSAWIDAIKAPNPRNLTRQITTDESGERVIRSRPSQDNRNLTHYLVAGRDGHVEVAAERYTWRAWRSDEAPRWSSGYSLAFDCDGVTASGAGVD